MSQLTDYSLEIMAKGWVSLNKDKPEHIQEVELAKLLKEIKSVCEPIVPCNKTFPVSLYNKTFMNEGYTMDGVCEFTGKHGTVTRFRRGASLWMVDVDIMYPIDTDSNTYKVKPDTVLL